MTWIVSLGQSESRLYLKLIIGSTVLTVTTVYAPQVGLPDTEKDAFYDKLGSTVASIPDSNTLMICVDWNGHIGKETEGYEEAHGRRAYGVRNTEGERVLEFAVAHNMTISNSWFAKSDNHLITYESGGAKTQVDYILVRKQHRKDIRDTKVIPGEECAPQHRLLVYDFRVPNPVKVKHHFQPRIRTWRLKDPNTKASFKQEVQSRLSTGVGTKVEDI